MRVEVIQNGRVLKHISHNGETYVESPTGGNYAIRVTNDCPRRRMIVLSVDGINVINGKDAGYSGPGYVLFPWQTATINGWLRSNTEVAAFEFKAIEGSYATQTGRGAKNVGIIGVAVFEEKEKPVFLNPPVTVIHEHHHHHPPPYRPTTIIYGTTTGDSGPPSYLGIPISNSPTMRGMNLDSSQVQSTMDSYDVAGGASAAEAEDTPSVSASVDLGRVRGATASSGYVEERDYGRDHSPGGGSGVTSNRKARSAGKGGPDKDSPIRSHKKGGGGPPPSTTTYMAQAPTKDVGTGYGQRVTQYTDETEFERASDQPVLVLSLRYATRERLVEWGIPIDGPVQAEAPNPFPASTGAVPSPPGWRG